jgi:hypothetical protein
MSSFLKGLALGGVAAIIISSIFYLAYQINDDHDAMVGRCIERYDTPQAREDLEIRLLITSEGFSSFDELVKSRCEKWIKNGQRF